MNTIYLILFGFLGVFIRSIVGILKNKAFTKKSFNTKKFLFTIILSGLIGVFCALLTIEDFRLILLAGYAGTDLIQGVYKLTRK